MPKNATVFPMASLPRHLSLPVSLEEKGIVEPSLRHAPLAHIIKPRKSVDMAVMAALDLPYSPTHKPSPLSPARSLLRKGRRGHTVEGCERSSSSSSGIATRFRSLYHQIRDFMPKSTGKSNDPTIIKSSPPSGPRCKSPSPLPAQAPLPTQPMECTGPKRRAQQPTSHSSLSDPLPSLSNLLSPSPLFPGEGLSQCMKNEDLAHHSRTSTEADTYREAITQHHKDMLSRSGVGVLAMAIVG
ncbi:MAG: hypothetical protein DHS80DRAFT_25299 [Piptocephalis tieghemiana]|nr:MAG: hypothetical protein DHS80DRAFT_25299 [Piptocephalis tieghemiana]